MLKDVVFWCPTHGDLFAHRSVDVTVMRRTTKGLVACREDVTLPSEGDEIRCPLCRGYIEIQIRPAT